MKKTLIADAGSTKVEWVIISGDGNIEARVTTHGLNALMADPEEVARLFAKAKSLLKPVASVDEIYYYGAGCATPVICKKIKDALMETWATPGNPISDEDIHVDSDLLGAARALLGHKPGIACILGTGSNSCLYDGEKITHNVPSLGFILGDEGSGAALGKRLISDAFKGQLPELVRDNFLSLYELTQEEILDYTYRRPAANRFLASLVPFLKDHLWNPYVYSLVREEFKSFLKRNVSLYPGSHSLPLSFTGSIAYFFADILSEAADAQGLKVGKIEKSPMEGLIAFHSSKSQK